MIPGAEAAALRVGHLDCTHLRSTGSVTGQHQLLQREQGPLLGNVLLNLLALELQRQHFQARAPRRQGELNVPAGSAGVGLPTNPVGRFRMTGMLGIKRVILSADAQPNRRNSPGQRSLRMHGSQSHSPTCRTRRVGHARPGFRSVWPASKRGSWMHDGGSGGRTCLE